MSFSSLKSFSLWFSFGVPVYLAGAVIIAALQNIFLGICVLAVFLAWIFKSAHTTCARCGFYGTTTCGLPGIVVPFITRKKTDALSTQAIRRHYFLDLFIMFFALSIYLFCLPLFPFACLWVIGAWGIVYGPKRFHGLLPRLKVKPSRNFTV
jgi:hypothetical protein